MTGPQLRALRERHGLSQADVAGWMGVQRSRVGSIENMAKVTPVTQARYLRAVDEAVRAAAAEGAA